jgi:hypothetical protein
MADNDLEDMINSNSDSQDNKANGHNNPEIIKSLEERAKQRKPKGLIGKILDYTITAGAVAASYSLIGTSALIANAISFVGARIVNYKRKRNTPSRQTRNMAITASLFSIPGHYAFQYMNKLFNVATWSGLGARFAAQNFVYYPAMTVTGNLIGYPLVHGTTKGLYSYGIKDLGWRNWKTSFKYFSIPNLLVARYLPPETHFPIDLGMGLLWRTTVGSRYLHEADPYKYEHSKIDGTPANGQNKEYKKAA